MPLDSHQLFLVPLQGQQSYFHLKRQLVIDIFLVSIFTVMLLTIKCVHEMFTYLDLHALLPFANPLQPLQVF